MAAAVLHDVLEDTDAQRSQLQERFGEEVAALVAAVSDDPEITDEEERKDELRQRVRATGGDAAAIYAADRSRRCASSAGWRWPAFPTPKPSRSWSATASRCGCSTS